MTLRRGLICGGSVIGGTLLLLTLTLLFLPSQVLVEVVQRAMARQGLTLEVSSTGKAYPLGLVAKKVVVSSNQGSIVAADQLTFRVHFLPLFVGRLQWSAEAVLDSGALTLVGTLGKHPKVEVTSKNLRMESLPILKTALGGSVQGSFTISGTLTGTWPKAKGNLKFEATAVDLHDVSLGGIRLPDALYRTVRGQLAVDGGMVTLQSFALDGDGIYARLKGSFPVTAPITAAPLNLTLEIMPKPNFIDKQKLIFLVLTRFMVSAGNFQIPVKGTLGNPAVF